MSKLKNIVRSALEVNAILPGVREEYLMQTYGDNYKEVRATNVTLGVLSWTQLAVDISRKAGWKKTVGNQVAITCITLAVNIGYNQDVQASIKNLIEFS